MDKLNDPIKINDIGYTESDNFGTYQNIAIVIDRLNSYFNNIINVNIAKNSRVRKMYNYYNYV